MTFNPATESPTLPDTSIAKAGDENQLVFPEKRGKKLHDLILSLSHKLDELAQLNERLFQTSEEIEKKNIDLEVMELDKFTDQSTPPDAFTEPVLVYRLSSLLELLKPKLGFHNWAVFLLLEDNSDIKKVASSSESTGDKLSEDFENEVKAQWESGNIDSVVKQKKRMMLPVKTGNLLIIPFNVLGKLNGFWAVQIEKESSLETKSSADWLGGADLITTCLESSYLNKFSFSTPEKNSDLLKEEKLFTVFQLSRAMVHEINNYLQIILGRIQIARMNQNKSPESTSNVTIWETIERNADRVCNTLKNFSDFLHRQSDELNYRTEVNLQHILENNLNLLKYILKTKQIELEQKIDESLPVVGGDPGEVEQAYLSLIWMISDYLTSGGNIRLQASKEKESFCLNVYWVEKNGEKDKYSDSAEFQNKARFRLVSQIMEKYHGGVTLEEKESGERKFIMRF